MSPESLESLGKSPRKEPRFGGALQNMETGSDFAIGLISSPRWEQGTTEAPPFKRSRSREKGGEKNGPIDVLATRTPSTALQTFESTAGPEIGPSGGFWMLDCCLPAGQATVLGRLVAGN